MKVFDLQARHISDLSIRGNSKYFHVLFFSVSALHLKV